MHLMLGPNKVVFKGRLLISWSFPLGPHSFIRVDCLSLSLSFSLSQQEAGACGYGLAAGKSIGGTLGLCTEVTPIVTSLTWYPFVHTPSRKTGEARSQGAVLRCAPYFPLAICTSPSKRRVSLSTRLRRTAIAFTRLTPSQPC